MKRKFSLAHLTILGCPPPEMVYVAAMTGYDFVSPRVIPLGEPEYNLAENKLMMSQTKKALADTGLKALDIELARIVPDLDSKTYLPAFEAGAELGATQVISSIWTEDRAFATECFAELCDLARPFGLTINLEYLPFGGIGELKGIFDVIRKADRPNSGFLCDTLYMSPSRVRSGDLSEAPRKWFNFVHLCDGPKELPPLKTEEMFRTVREARLYPGEGGIDIAAIMREIPKVPCSIELPNSARVQELGYAEHARRCLSAAKKYFNAKVDVERKLEAVGG